MVKYIGYSNARTHSLSSEKKQFCTLLSLLLRWQRQWHFRKRPRRALKGISGLSLRENLVVTYSHVVSNKAVSRPSWSYRRLHKFAAFSVLLALDQCRPPFGGVGRHYIKDCNLYVQKRAILKAGPFYNFC